MKPETLKARSGQELIDYFQTNGQTPNVMVCKVVWHNNFREAEIAKIRIVDSTYSELYGYDEEYLFYSRNLEEFGTLLANITTDRLNDLQDPATCYDNLNEDELSDSGEDFTIIDVVDMYYEPEPLDKEFTSDNGFLTLTRRDYYSSFPIPMEASQFNDSKMQELVNTIAVHLDKEYRFTKEDIDNVDNYYAQDVLWELIETVALSMGMEYCEDVARKKKQELLELANESITMFDEDGYIQFEKSIALNKTTYPEYDWIDGIQLVEDNDSIVVWLSTENSEDIFSSDIELFDEHTIDEMKSALQNTIKHLLKKS
jgi:intracellular sulfur oxidation DsrE/DsrF family protein